MGKEKGDLMRADGTCVAFGLSDCYAVTLVMVVAGTVHHALSVPWLGVEERKKRAIDDGRLH